MKESEIRKLFSEALKIDDARTKVQVLGLRGFKIDNLSYSINFVLDQTGLVQVELSPERDKGDWVIVDASQSQLIGILRDKYGQPLEVRDEDLGGGKLHKWEWIFPETLISLQFA